MQPFTSLQWGGNHSSAMLYNLIKITQLFGEQKSNFHVHRFIVGQVEESCPLVTNTQVETVWSFYSFISLLSPCQLLQYKN